MSEHEAAEGERQQRPRSEEEAAARPAVPSAAGDGGGERDAPARRRRGRRLAHASACARAFARIATARRRASPLGRRSPRPQPTAGDREQHGAAEQHRHGAAVAQPGVDLACERPPRSLRIRHAPMLREVLGGEGRSLAPGGAGASRVSRRATRERAPEHGRRTSSSSTISRRRSSARGNAPSTSRHAGRLAAAGVVRAARSRGNGAGEDRRRRVARPPGRRPGRSADASAR